MPLYILYHDSTFLRECILKLDIKTLRSNKPPFNFSRAIDVDRLAEELVSPKYFQQLLLKAVAYNQPEQTTLLPDSFKIEHVFDSSDEQLGNLTLLEPELGKKITGSSFKRKKEIYLESSIAMTRALIDEPDEWTPDAIAIRSNKLADSLINLWQKWSDDYDHQIG